MKIEGEPPEGDDELLREAALGSLDRSAPAVVARLRDDPEFARAVAELERTRTTTARVLGEGAQLTMQARRQASAADRTLVHAALESLARGGRARPSARRRWSLFVLCLAAALVLGFFLVLGQRSSQTVETWLGPAGGDIEYVPAANGPCALRWSVDLRAGEALALSFYAFRDDARQELLLGPLAVGTTGWQADEEATRVLSADWIAELWREEASGPRLLGQVRHSAPR